jgi:2-polyprenyl-6-methoxyphenol hydroxylase-like FAD-dependent oxidoreductase
MQPARNSLSADILIIGAGPVGLMCAYLGLLSGLSTVIIDKSSGPLEVGRADALNARTLQLFELVGLFKDLYPLGKSCNTSSVWANGKFISRQSSWWENLEGCFHKHFLMIGQPYVENLLNERINGLGSAVERSTEVLKIEIKSSRCLTTLSNGKTVESSYVIGADGAQSFVRNHFKIPFEITRPQIIWAVIDGVIQTDFPKVPEIIVFQNDSADVAWIPREGSIDRFYVRMDSKDFTFKDAVDKINKAVRPHSLSFKKIVWYSQFSVKESVAENFFIHDCIFLAGDSCHIHSVNGGQGLNTGIADAFNLIWKLNLVLKFNISKTLLKSYENERKSVAKSVIDTSGELVRATKASETGNHAQDYVKIIQKRAGNITGMGIRYHEDGLIGSRIFDMMVHYGSTKTRLYSLLKYTHYTLLIFGEANIEVKLPKFVHVIQISRNEINSGYWAKDTPYDNLAILVRPDSYIHSVTALNADVNLLWDPVIPTLHLR